MYFHIQDYFKQRFIFKIKIESLWTSEAINKEKTDKFNYVKTKDLDFYPNTTEN